MILIHVLVFADAQIVADHTVVDLYDDIPEQWMDSVRTMLVDIAGESHSAGYRDGMELLEALDADYQVTTYLGTRPAPSSTYVRLGGHGTVGEANFYTSPSAIEAYKTHITNQNETSNPYDVMGFGWCWDMDRNGSGGTIDPEYDVRWSGSSVGGPDGDIEWGLDAGDVSLTGNSVTMDTYLDAVEQYNQLCTDNGYSTKIVFTTGPVDMYGGTEEGFQREIKHDYIRDYVAADETRILFDYADILCWNDDGEYYTSTWDDGGEDRAHANIHPDNLEGGYTAHIGNVGALRLAKAMWWMLARIAGWDGKTPVSQIQISAENGATELITGGDLQFTASILPENASNQEVDWGVINGTGTASISSLGLLHGELPGSVEVVALAQDGSGVGDTLDFIITDPVVPVSNITLTTEGDVVEIMTGASLLCSATVLPADATNPELIWTVINGTGSGSVTSSGMVRGLSAGSITVVASAQDGSGVSDSFDLSIILPEILVNSIEITSSGNVTSIESGSDLQFWAEVLPEDANNLTVEWRVINGVGTATITQNGLMEAGNPGTVAVLATAIDGSEVADTFYLNIDSPQILVESIVVTSAGGLSTLVSGSTLQFYATVFPEDAVNTSVDWSISAITGSAHISESGLLRADNPGTVLVQAIARDGSDVSGSFQLSITPPSDLVESVTLSSAGGITEVKTGETLQFSATVLPAEAANKEVDWSITEISGSASIDGQGLVTAGNPGIISVIASARDGSGVSGSFNMTITQGAVEVSDIQILTAGGVTVVDEGDMLQLSASINPDDASNPAVFWHVVSVSKNTGSGTITSDGMFIALAEGKVDAVAIAQDGSGVSDQITLTVLSPVISGIEEFTADQLVLFPNPGKDLFYLNVGDLEVELVQVVDSRGGIVLEQKPDIGSQVLIMDLGRKTPGIYFVKLYLRE